MEQLTAQFKGAEAFRVSSHFLCDMAQISKRNCNLNDAFPASSFRLAFCLFQEAECAYTLFVVAVFWLTEALPLSVTALLPGLMFPLFGIMPSKQVSSLANVCHSLLFYADIFLEKGYI